MQEPERKKRKRIKSKYRMEHLISYVSWRIKKKYPGVEYKDIRLVIRLYFDYCGEELALGNKIYLNKKLGNLYLEKQKREIKYNPETDTIENNLPVNIPETLKLWREYPELRKKKFVRFTNDHSNGYTFRLKFEVSKANFKNKQVYDFKFSETIKKKLSSNIIEKKVDAFLNKFDYSKI